MTQITEYSRTEAALSDLASRFKGVVYDVATSKGFEEARKARGELRTYRTDLEKLRVDIKAPALERCRLIDAEAKRITAELVALEDPIDAQIKAEEDRRAREKAEREQRDRERIAAIQARIAAIRRTPVDAIGKSATVIGDIYAALSAITVTPDEFAEFTDEATTTKEAALEVLGESWTAKKADEAERERLRVEAEDLARQRREQEAAAKAERERMAAEEKAARQARDRADAEAREAREAADRTARVARDEQERIARETREAEEKRLADQRAQQRIEADRLDAVRRETERQAYSLAAENAAKERERLRVEAEQEAERERVRATEARAAALREKIKAAKHPNASHALMAIAAICIDQRYSDADARAEIGIICEANLPKRERAAA